MELDKDDIYSILGNLSIKLDKEIITEPIGDEVCTYGERRVGTKITISLKMGDDLISEDSIIIKD